MFELWYGIVALMFTAYVVLDGYDLGAGALHLLVAKNDAERRAVIAAIGPFWDANEVWLLAAGGALFVAFPAALAAGLSGFYLAIFLVLWCLIGRAIGLEFRSHVEAPLWRSFWDVIFGVTSALLPVFFGAALGNLIRGVPLTTDGWFALTLFTHFDTQAPVGLLDWYTVLSGVFALVALTAHGATLLAWRTEGRVHERSARLVPRLYALVVVLWLVATVATIAVQPAFLAALPARPLAWLGLAVAVAGVAAVFGATARGLPLTAFVGSCAFLAGMLGATAACLFPAILPAVAGAAGPSITAYNGGGNTDGLRTALGWWSLGFPIVVFYFVVLFRIHRPVRQESLGGFDRNSNLD